MRVGIDCRFIGTLNGIGRYTRELIAALAQLDTESQYFLYFSSQSDLARMNAAGGNVHHVLAPRISGSYYGSWYLPQIYRDRLDVFHATHGWALPLAWSIPTVMTCHDLISKAGPSVLSKRARLYGSIMLPVGLTFSERVITVSEFSQSEIVRHFPRVAHKISVIPHGVGPEFCPEREPHRIDSLKKSLGIAGQYLLFVGSLKRHKNVPALLQAYQGLPTAIKTTCQLVICVGHTSTSNAQFVNSVRELGIENSVRVVGDLSSSDLALLYAGAAAFITVSLLEGFCLPAVEAMACGTPVIASSTTAAAEITGEAGLVVNPVNVEEISAAIHRLLTDARLAGELREKGLERAKVFSWKRSAERHLAVYRELAIRR